MLFKTRLKKIMYSDNYVFYVTCILLYTCLMNKDNSSIQLTVPALFYVSRHNYLFVAEYCGKVSRSVYDRISNERNGAGSARRIS